MAFVDLFSSQLIVDCGKARDIRTLDQRDIDITRLMA